MSGDFPGAGLVEHMGAASADVVAEEAISEDVYDVVSPLTPCYRRGVVLQAVAISGDSRRAIRRDAFQARQLGLALVKREGDICAGVRSAIESAGTKLGIEVSSLHLRDHEVMSRFAPGLILDFPSHEFRLGRLTVRERSCVTVCYNEAASKVWTRFIISNLEGETVSSAELASFYSFCDAASTAARANIGRIYLSEFREQYQGSSRIEFEEIGSVEFVGIDTDLIQFDQFVSADGVGPILGSNRIPERDKEIFVRFFQSNLELFFPKRFKRAEISAIASDAITVFRSDFEYRALYHGIFREKTVTFLVLSEPGRAVEAYDHRESGALTVISELAARAVGGF